MTRFLVRVMPLDGVAFEVGPFDLAGGLRGSGSAMDWLYRQLGLLMTHFPDARLIKHRWEYRESGFCLLADQTFVDVKLELAGFVFELLPIEGDTPLRPPHTTDVIDELIEPRPIAENL